MQDPEIPRFTTVPSPYGEEEARHWQRSATTGVRRDRPPGARRRRRGRAPLGAVGLHNLDPETRALLGRILGRRARPRPGGCRPRALALLCRFAFDELGVKRIELWIEPVNDASLRVADAVGFHREGLLRSFMPIGGVRRDMLMYSLLPEDLGWRRR